MKLKNFLMLVILVVYISGCMYLNPTAPILEKTSTSPSVLPEPWTLTPSPFDIHSTSATPTHHRLPTLGVPVKTYPTLAVPPTNTQTPILPTSTQVEEYTIPECPGKGVPISPPNGFGLNGAILYLDNINEQYMLTGGIPLSSSVFFLSSDDRIHGFSPDGKWLAYSKEDYEIGVEKDINSFTINLLSSQGGIISNTFDLTEAHNYLHGLTIDGWAAGWVNNEIMQIYLSYKGLPPLYIGIVMFVDPFEGKWRNDLLAGFPDMMGINGFEISSDTQRILWSASDIYLFDTVQHGGIWGDPDLSTPNGVYIGWAPNSSMVAYKNRFPFGGEDKRLFVVSRDGKDKHPITQVNKTTDFIPLSFSWTSDSQKLAVGGVIIQDKVWNISIYIYDMKLSRFTYRCPFKPIGDPTNGYIHSILTSDNRFILYQYSYQPFQESPIMILDLQTGDVYKLVEDAYLIGWTDKFSLAEYK